MIVPENGELKKIAQQLLSLADNPKDVDYVMWPEPGFRVPEELAGRFVALRKSLETPKADVPAVEGASADEAPVEPVKRKPGRPKKNVEDQ